MNNVVYMYMFMEYINPCAAIIATEKKRTLSACLALFSVLLVKLETYFLEQMCPKRCSLKTRQGSKLDQLYFLNCSTAITRLKIKNFLANSKAWKKLKEI